MPVNPRIVGLAAGCPPAQAQSSNRTPQAWQRGAVYGTSHWDFQYGAFVLTGLIVIVGLACYAATQRHRWPTTAPEAVSLSAE